ncbi:MAG: protein-L-isoaspartate O-methyltransferase [Ignavibacteria bacterium RIFCSPLOWO2_12_FULL_56_21]|nr:MAG: protein-L-isoaspartate O-methyltransferase [Ignavibacteria bacterium RIFCSPLOWO2_12_FULL_56_21]HAV22363.1 protein-L-isoaspartate O-methyltransferase [Bacteroidota bacterium]
MNRLLNERKDLIETLRSKGIRNERVLKALGKVERQLFVLPPFARKAYEDTALPIASGQTISQPYTVAFMTEQLDPKSDGKILEIGTGSGYQAAVLAELGCRVFTIERHMELHLQSRKLLEQLGYRVASKCGDGTVGWTEFSPYDGIIVTAAAPQVPDPLISQLADGGRLVIPVGDTETQDLRVITKTGETLEQRDVHGFKFVPLIGKMGWER